MHADEPAVLAGAAKRPENRLVVDHEHAGIGHEQFETGDALVAHHAIHLAQSSVLELGHDHVEAVIDHGITFGSTSPVIERMPHRLASILDCKINDAGRAAERSGDGAGLEVVGRGRAAERHVQVRVNVDPPGMTYFPEASIVLSA